MRIIGGEYKSRRITPPGNLPVRPTTDLAREALFNLLQTRIDLTECIVLDLFSGTGFVSYEFCSRGAQQVIAVEKHPACIAFIRKTAEMLGMGMLEIRRDDVFRFLKTAQVNASLAFADPPFDLPSLAELPDLVMQSDALTGGGLFILEHGRNNDFGTHPSFVELRKYGKVHFSFFTKPA